MEGVAKDPNTPDNPRVGARLKSAGQAVDIDFTGKTDRSPNTVRAHVVLDFALNKHGWVKQNILQEILFRNYFTDGIYPSDQALVLAAKEAGLPSEEFESLLAQGEAKHSDIYSADSKVKQKGVHGVPYFYFNNTDFGLSGAQDPNTFIEAFAKCENV
mmetsp:Transcript_39665/g.55078  ORF Transcript_39665/g.55078 Transcript_39665/m.55078 type:complete len:158 (-) Transcript_39665:263-736(-)